MYNILCHYILSIILISNYIYTLQCFKMYKCINIFTYRFILYGICIDL